MHLYASRAEFDACLGTVKKWMRTGQALDQAPALSRGVAYSIGDSLTYWWDGAAALATDDLRASRRYLTVLAPHAKGIDVEVAPVCGLSVTKEYSDITDREHLGGAGEVVHVDPGAILVVDIEEAFRVLPSPDVPATLVRVTVEGYSFPNK